ncbi:hypothetical protein ABEB36_003630 [Hypothenemus hampei]|uniref:Uncharacterized protein n=1 Tax=Hypothenemus hampei TaxID=57062 RepID=A0ABD1F9S4_HYPHA
MGIALVNDITETNTEMEKSKKVVLEVNPIMKLNDQQQEIVRQIHLVADVADDQRNQLLQTSKTYNKVFGLNSIGIGCRRDVKARINLIDNYRPYCIYRTKKKVRILKPYYNRVKEKKEVIGRLLWRNRNQIAKQGKYEKISRR